MDVFSIREKIITAYSEYAQSFIQIQDDRIRSHVDYRSKRVILEIYDQMMALPAMHVPAPKPEHGQMKCQMFRSGSVRWIRARRMRPSRGGASFSLGLFPQSAHALAGVGRAPALPLARARTVGSSSFAAAIDRAAIRVRRRADLCHPIDATERCPLAPNTPALRARAAPTPADHPIPIPDR